MKILALSFSTLLFFSAPASAEIKLKNFHSFETAAGTKTGAAFGEIVNEGSEKEILTGVTTKATDRAEIHEMSDENGVMKMRRIEKLEIPAGETVTLSPQSYHVMLLDLKEPLKTGETVPLTLVFQHSGKVETDAQVKSRAPSKNTAHHMDHSAHH